MIIASASTDQSIYFKLVHPTTFVPVTGATITDLDAVYIRDLEAAVKNDLTALVAVTTAHTDNKAIEIDATNAPGVYRVDFPDAAFAAGVSRVQLVINGAAIAPAIKEVELGVPVAIATAVGAQTAESYYTWQEIIASLDYMINKGMGGVRTWTAGSMYELTAALLVTPENKLATDADGAVTTATVTGNVEGDVVGDVQGTVLGDVTLSAAERNSIADALLKRDWTGLTGEASRSMLNALRFLRNKWSIATTTLTVTKEDDTEAAWTAALSVDADADPIVGVDPA